LDSDKLAVAGSDCDLGGGPATWAQKIKKIRQGERGIKVTTLIQELIHVLNTIH